MKNYKLFFPTKLSEINPENDNIDVIVTLSSGENYTLVVATPNNIYSLMQKDNVSFFPVGSPFIFVSVLNYENICNVVETMFEDDFYWLKYYGEKLN